MARVPTNTGGANVRTIAAPRQPIPSFGPTQAAVGRATSAAQNIRTPQIRLPKVQAQTVDTSGVTRGMFGLAGAIDQRADERRAFQEKLWVQNKHLEAKERYLNWINKEAANPVDLTDRMKQFVMETEKELQAGAPSEKASAALKAQMADLMIAKMPQTFGAELAFKRSERVGDVSEKTTRQTAMIYHDPLGEDVDVAKESLQEDIKQLIDDGMMDRNSSEHNRMKDTLYRYEVAQIEGLLAKVGSEVDGQDYAALAQGMLEGSTIIPGTKRDELQRRINRTDESANATVVRDLKQSLRNTAAKIESGGEVVEQPSDVELDQYEALAKDIGDPILANDVKRMRNAPTVGVFTANIDQLVHSDIKQASKAITTSDEYAATDITSKNIIQRAITDRAELLQKDVAQAMQTVDGVWQKHNQFIGAMEEVRILGTPESIDRAGTAWRNYSGSQRGIQEGQGLKGDQVQVFTKAALASHEKKYRDFDNLPQNVERDRQIYGDDFNTLIDQLSNEDGLKALPELTRVVMIQMGDPANTDVVEALIQGWQVKESDLPDKKTQERVITQADRMITKSSWYNNFARMAVERHMGAGNSMAHTVYTALLNKARSDARIGLDPEQSLGVIFDQLEQGYFQSSDGERILNVKRRDGSGRVVGTYDEQTLEKANAYMEYLSDGLKAKHFALIDTEPLDPGDKQAQVARRTETMLAVSKRRTPGIMRYVLDPSTLQVAETERDEVIKARAQILREQTWWAANPSETRYSLRRHSGVVGSKDIRTKPTPLNDMKGGELSWTIDEMAAEFDALAEEIKGTK